MIVINGEIVASGVASRPITLFPGINAITVSVEAPDGEGTKRYALEVRVGSNELNGLTITEIRFADGTPKTLLASWESESGVVYFLERSADLLAWESFGDEVTGVGESASVEIDIEQLSVETLFLRVGRR